jgi:NADH:ubiquinone oxidoreductase subunit B-like Fe-S oxidoreductase
VNATVEENNARSNSFVNETSVGAACCFVAWEAFFRPRSKSQRFGLALATRALASLSIIGAVVVLETAFSSIETDRHVAFLQRHGQRYKDKRLG